MGLVLKSCPDAELDDEVEAMRKLQAVISGTDCSHPTVSSTDIASNPTLSSTGIASNPTFSSTHLNSEDEGKEAGENDPDSSHRSVSAEEIWMAGVHDNPDLSSEPSMKANPNTQPQLDAENQWKSWM